MEMKMPDSQPTINDLDVGETADLEFEEKNCLRLRLSLVWNNLKSEGKFDKLVDDLLTDYRSSLGVGRRLKESVYRPALRMYLANLLSCGRSLWLKAPGAKDYYYNYSNNNPLNIRDTAPRNLRIWLEREGLVQYHPGFKSQHPMMISFYGRIKPLPKLINRFVDLFGEDYSQSDEIKLLDKRASYLEKKDRNGKYLRYESTRVTRSMEASLRRYNSLLQDSTITMNGMELLAPAVFRVFNNDSWKQGGRFYGGPWEIVDDEVRGTITINGEKVVELDYSALHPCILYAERGLKCEGYPYDVQGVERKLAKSLILLMINNSSKNRARRSFIDSQRNKKNREFESEQVDKWLAACENRHSPIFDSLYKKNGLRLHYLDSRIAQKVMAHFLKKGVLALPVHDSFLVPERFEAELREIMLWAYREVIDRKGLGLTIEIGRKGVGAPSQTACKKS